MLDSGRWRLRLLLRWVNVRLRIRLPELLLAVICTTVVVANWRLDKQGRQDRGRRFRPRLPSFELPHVDWSRVHALASSSLAIAMLGLLEAIAMAKAIAANTRQKLDINQQCLSEGVANVVGQYVSVLSRVGFADAFDNQPAGGRANAMVGRDFRGGGGADRRAVRAVCVLTFRRRGWPAF